MKTEPKQHQQHRHHQLQQVATFLPMLCSKPSMIKNVHIPNPFNNNNNNNHSASSCHRSAVHDPSLSPKVGCMGQVKKKADHHQHHNNYNLCMVFPTTTTTSYSVKNPNTETGHVSSYSKLLSLFSSKTLMASTPLSSTCRKDHHHHQKKKISRSVSGVRHSRMRSRSCDDDDDGGGSVIGFGSPIDVADMDPPLPVVINRKTSSSSSTSSITSLSSEGDNNKINSSSLWKRRSGGAALKGLEIQQVHIPIQSSTTTTSSI